jgi:hypothetical protein
LTSVTLEQAVAGVGARQTDLLKRYTDAVASEYWARWGTLAAGDGGAAR